MGFGMAIPQAPVMSVQAQARQRVMRGCAKALALIVVLCVISITFDEILVRALVRRQVRAGMKESELLEKWGKPAQFWRPDPSHARAWWISTDATVTGSALLYTRFYFFGNVMVVYLSPDGTVERVDVRSSS
jgi:hypothetical protein